jgi:hypothetical protein
MIPLHLLDLQYSAHTKYLYMGESQTLELIFLQNYWEFHFHFFNAWPIM